MALADTTKDIAATVSKLSLETPAKAADLPKTETSSKKTPAVADSWEDEDVSSASEDNNDSQPSTTTSDAKTGTFAPPPTPISPISSSNRQFSPASEVSSPVSSVSSSDNQHDSGNTTPPTGVSSVKRPEKTDAVARRMIASALGMKMPKQTEEQRAYEKALREKERKRRQEEREAQRRKEEEAARAKQAIWDD